MVTTDEEQLLQGYFFTEFTDASMPPQTVLA